MKRRQIIGAIMLATGETVPALAAKHNYTKQALYDVIKGRTKTPHLQALVSSITGFSVSKLWPEPQSE